MERTIVTVHYGDTTKYVQCRPGMDVTEVRSVLKAAFGVDAVGLQSAEGVLSPLSFLCAAPSSFVGEFQLLAQKQTRRTFEDLLKEDEKFRSEFGDFSLNLEFRDVCSVFIAAGDSLDLATFETCVTELTRDEREKTVFHRIWRAFSEAHKDNSKLCTSALLVGLSTVTKGDARLKLSETFALFDQNGISKAEMTRYFYAVFLVEREKDPKAFTDQSLLSLAVSTSDHCFDAAELDHDAAMTFDRFETWCSLHHQEIEHPTTETTTPVVSEPPAVQPSLLPRGLDYLKNLFFGEDISTTIEEKAEALYSHLMSESLAANGLVSRSRFVASLVEDPALDEAKRSERLGAALEVFGLFDPQATGYADAAAVAAGVTGLLCVEDNAIVHAPPVRVFLGGVFSKNSLAAYLRCVLAMSSRVDEAPQLAEQCFLDSAESDKLAASAFTKWWTRNKEEETMDRSTIEAATCVDAFTLRELREIVGKKKFDDAANLTKLFLELRRIYADRRGLTTGPEDALIFDQQGGKAIVRGLLKAVGDELLFGLSVFCSCDSSDLFDLLSADGRTVAKKKLQTYLETVANVEALISEEQKDVTLKDVPSQGLTKAQFLHWICRGGDLEYKQEIEYKQEEPFERAVRSAGLRDLDASRAVALLAERADDAGYVDKDTFVAALGSTVDAKKALADIFDVIKHSNDVLVHADLGPDQLQPRRLL